MTMNENRRLVIAAGLAWLFDTTQPDGAIVSHHGVTVGVGDRRYRFIPRGAEDRPVVVVDAVAVAGQDVAVLEPDELTELTGVLAELGHEVVDRWNGHPAGTGSLALAGAVQPSLLAALDRYHAGCPDHGGSVFCDCGWFRAGYRLLVMPLTSGADRDGADRRRQLGAAPHPVTPATGVTAEARRIRRHRVVLAAGTALTVAAVLTAAVIAGPFSRITLLCLILGVPTWALVAYAFHVLNTTSKGGSQ